MLGGELLMALAQGQRLRGLDEPASAVGVFLDIHGQSLPSGPKPGTRLADLTGASAAEDVGSNMLGWKGDFLDFRQS